MPPGPFAEKLKEVMQSHKDFPRLLKKHQDNPNDVETIGKLVVIYQSRQNGKRASELLAEGEKKDPENLKGYLTKAYNAVGDIHQEKGEFDKAIPLFRKAAKTGKSPRDIVYARFSITSCCLMQQKWEDAVPPLKAVLETPDITKEEKEQAEQMLQWIQSRMEEGKKKGSGK